MKLSLIAAIALLVFSLTIVRSEEGFIGATGWNPQPVRLTTNTTIANFIVSAGENDLQLAQLALGVKVTGTWIYHQVINVRLLDDHDRNVIAGPERIWSNPIVCDSDNGRVTFANITNFIIKANMSRIVTVIADIAGTVGTTVEPCVVTVSYRHGDSRVIETQTLVNETLSPILNVGKDIRGDVVIESTTVPADYAKIDMFTIEQVPGTNLKSLNLFGLMEPYSTYKVEASTDLIQWEEIGMVNNPGWSQILKEPAVGLLSEKYDNTSFFRLKKIVP